ncbi:hypothetical protein L1987_13457 [Smallanthus sonchifolius]|uniref:Uncharacterized protein n=1 Tax=Smallanthus sonchifolius TaxID=185202 RepID=A0ACB9JIV3_9ASTR|nr:hypothetical protein L1987_13457 [Smallanthus sonchifolius]
MYICRIASDDEEPTEVTSENHSDGSTAKLPSSWRKSPFYVPGGPSYSLVADDADSAPPVSPHPALPTQPMPPPPRQGARTRLTTRKTTGLPKTVTLCTQEPEMQTPTQEVEEPNYGARESWMIEMFQMKADIEDDQIRIIKRLQALERHKREQLATNEMFVGDIGTVKEDLVITREDGMAARDATRIAATCSIMTPLVLIWAFLTSLIIYLYY